MADSTTTPSPFAPTRAGSAPSAPTADPRVARLVEEHYDFVWRTLRFLGLDDATAEDGAQQVMCVLARKSADVRPGAEKSFLFSTAMRVVATMRRTERRRPVTPVEDFEAVAAAAPTAEDLVDERRAHELLLRVLDALPVELRIVFVLFELEEMSTPEIAAALGVPVGTASSRLRRARELFQASVRRIQAAQATPRRPRP